MKTGDKTSPQIITYIGMAAMIGFNILTIVFLLGMKVKEREALCIFFVLIFLMYFIFIYKKRYLEIYNRFIKKDPFPKLGNIIVESYIVISIIGLAVSAWIARG